MPKKEGGVRDQKIGHLESSFHAQSYLKLLFYVRFVVGGLVERELAERNEFLAGFNSLTLLLELEENPATQSSC